jgi:hypothetical protein
MHSTSNAMGGCPQGLQRVIKYWKSHGYKMVKVRALCISSWQQGCEGAAALFPVHSVPEAAGFCSASCSSSFAEAVLL